MIRAEIPYDVTEYKEQFFFGMTIRQLICIVAMIALAVPTFLVGKNIFTTDILMYAIVLEVAPLAAVGFLKYNGMGFEKIASKVTEFYIGVQHRKMHYFPPETEIHDTVRRIYLQELETERRQELKKLKKQQKRGKK